MRILLINPPLDNDNISFFNLIDYDKKARTFQIPIGLMYLKSYLDKDHDIEILDMPVLGLSINDIQKYIKNFNLIGITVTIGKWPTVIKLAKEIKKHTNISVIAGGVHVSLYPYESLQCKEIDYIISGFGQIPFKKLCERLEQYPGIEHNNVYNVYTRSNTDANTVGNFEFVDIDEFPFPDRKCLPIDDYIMPLFTDGSVTSMVTSIGCPYKCFFCACKNFQPVKIRKIENIINEMKYIQDLGISGILFNDELFTMSTKRITDICSGIINNNINLVWSVRSRANLVNLDTLKLMKKAGCVNIHLGIESGTNRILNRMNKKLTVDIIEKSVNTIKEAELGVTASFMLGYIDESESEILQTIEFAKKLELNSVQFYITCIESRTELYEELKPIKNLPDDIYADFTLNPDKIDLSKNIASTVFSKKEMDDFLRYAYSQCKSLYNIKKQ